MSARLMVVLLLLTLVGLDPTSLALAGQTPGQTPPRQGQAAGADTVRSLHVQGNVWMLVGNGVNAAMQVGDDGVLIVDTMTAPLADALLAEVRRVAGTKPIRHIVNTHVHPDHTGGNVTVTGAGESIVGGNAAPQLGPNASKAAQIFAHENVQMRMVQAEGAAAVPFAAQPTDTFFTPVKEIYFNGEAIQLFHRPKAHTDGDVVVFFRKSDVVVAGDLFVTTTFPIVDLARGGSLNGVVDSLNAILDLTVPRDKQEGGTYVIPGHGRLVDEADVVDYRDMVTIIRDRIRDAVQKKMTLEQVKAARLVRDYEGRFGATTGFWTTDAFVEAAYRSLSQR